MVGLTAVIGAILLLQQINNCGSALVPDLTVAQFTDILSDIYGTEAHCIEVLEAVMVYISLLNQINKCGSAFVRDVIVALFTDILCDIYGMEAHCIEVLDAVTYHPWVITCIGNALIVAAIIARLISRQPTGAEL